MSRAKLLRKIDSTKRILEIGPLASPNMTRRQAPHVFYADIRSTEEVRAYYKSDAAVRHDDIVPIDFVIQGSYRDTFANTSQFDFVLATHVLEHIANPILFLTDIASILTEHGKLCLALPDKRYCFDYFRDPTGFRDWLDVFWNGQTQSARMALDYFFNYVPDNDPLQILSKPPSSEPLHQISFAEVSDRYLKMKSGDLTDVHFWVFTDYSFLKLIYDLTRANLISFQLKDFYPTPFGRQEFNLVLQKNSRLQSDAQLRNQYLLELESRMRSLNPDNSKWARARLADAARALRSVRNSILRN
jgi:SAM-dependent methyltransferase